MNEWNDLFEEKPSREFADRVVQSVREDLLANKERAGGSFFGWKALQASVLALALAVGAYELSQRFGLGHQQSENVAFLTFEDYELLDADLELLENLELLEQLDELEAEANI